MRKVAELTSDDALGRIAGQPEVIVPFEHLRHLDPETTTIVLGFRLDYAPDEADRLGLRHEGPTTSASYAARTRAAALRGLLRASIADYLVGTSLIRSQARRTPRAGW